MTEYENLDEDLLQVLNFCKEFGSAINEPLLVWVNWFCRSFDGHFGEDIIQMETLKGALYERESQVSRCF